VGQELVVPESGEIVFLDDPLACARVLYEIADLEQRIKDLKGALRETIFKESEIQGTKTLHLGALDAVISTPSVTAWDYKVLRELLKAGLPKERFAELVQKEITYKVNGSVARQIKGASEVYAEIIERAQTKIPRNPSVYVSPTKRVIEE
jgi:alkylhydroperoxidase/carboxymuconolactone decarboxylase family protein YurZ